MKKKRKLKKSFQIILCALILGSTIFASVLYGFHKVKLNKEMVLETIDVLSYNANPTQDAVYLSDIPYIASQSYTRWDEIRYDEVNNGGKITLKIENGAFTFKKGIWAHANSQVVYDISEYNYNYFTAFVGLNATSTRGDGVRFLIYTSDDGRDWGEAKFNQVKLPGETATKVEIALNGANYLKLVANELKENGADHSVYANAKLVNDLSTNSAFKTVEEYDELIKNQYTGQTDLTGELEFNLLKRTLINNVGYFTINSIYNEDADNKAALDWLMSDQKALRYYILGGKPNGSYYNSLTELSRLYRNYKEDFANTEVTKYGTVLGELYLRMAISLSLTHSGVVGLWMQSSTPENKSDSVRRYAIMKYMHKNNLFKGPNNIDYNSWFEDYTVEEMRYVMMNNIDDESILWLNAYVQELIEKEGGARIWPHRYISYVWPNYSNPVYYAEENNDYFNQLFSVPDTENEGKRIGLWDLEYNIPGGKDVPTYQLKVTRGTSDHKVYKVWMNMRNKFGTGAVCGGISKTGANIRGVLGLPDAVVGQPGHAAHINYFRNSNGEGYWGIDNDVSGWAYTGPGGRSLLGWGNAPYASGYSGTYIPLAQEVVNHNDTYEQSQKFVYLANSYSDLAKKEEIYRKALEIQPLNLDAWYGLIQTYNASSAKTEDNYYELAKEIAESLKYYPLPMYQMTNLIKPKLTSIGASYQFTLLQTRILKEASATPDGTTEVLQPGITRLMANFLLGQMDTTIATFSFDGEDAGKIVLASRFDGNGVLFDYSINGKEETNFKQVSFTSEEEHKWQLTAEELAAITSENDLYIHIVGVNYSEENLYKIDIKESAGLPDTTFASDLENKMLGIDGSVQWKYEETDEWTFYKDAEPDLTGNKTVILRRGATGTYLASNTSTTYTFTEDIINEKRKYIPVSHLSLHAVSTETTSTNERGNAIYALDGNYNTRWHSDWNGNDTERYITVKLDHPYNISAVEFVPAGGGNGKIYDGTVWGSMDGENWIILTQQEGLTYTNSAETVAQAMANIKSFDMDAPQKVQYVKIVADRTNGNWFTARAFNFYEDTTIKNVASFSFDGKNAGVISLYDEFKNKSWKYSIDNGTTWQSVSEDHHQLTALEVEKIDVTSMIKIKFDEDESEYTVTIKKFEAPEKGYLNDFENKIIGQPDKEVLEWKFEGETKWHSYKDEEPTISITKTLLVRRKASGISMASNPIEYQFTDDNQKNEETYVPIEHLSIHGYSSQSRDSRRPYYAQNAIDGNIHTEWHTDFGIADRNAFIAIKLDQPRYISAIDYFHMDSTLENYGYMKDAVISISEDGENWTDVASVQNVPQEDLSKHIRFDESVYGQYVKISIKSYDNTFATAAMINIYEDLTKATVMDPKVEISYSATNSTNRDVVATISSESNIEIINNNGSNTYTFTKNGEFTFAYKDKTTNKKYTIKATVNNIDKDAPTAKIEYNTTEKTEGEVVATLKPSEDVMVTNNGGKFTYTFYENSNFTFEFMDKAGNTGTVTASVNWIEKKPDDKPNTPDDKPNIPDDKPNTPDDKPNIPDDQPSTPDDKPSTPDDKPTNNNTNSSPNGNPVDNIGNTTNSSNPPSTPEETYQTITGGNVMIKIPASILSQYKDATLDYQVLTLSDEEKNRYGKDSVVYKVSLKTKGNQEVNISNIPITQTIKLDSNKKFDAIYVVKEDGSVIKLDSTVNNNEIVFEDNGLGKYIVAYQSDKEENPGVNSNNPKPTENGELKEKSVNYLPYVLGGVVVVLVGIVIYCTAGMKDVH